jgi:hypothetical protein
MSESVQVLSAKDLIAHHEAWKLTLWAAAFSHKPLTVEELAQIVYPERCPIGRWLLSAASAAVRDSEEYRSVVQNHQEFHNEMMEVASMLSGKDFPSAKQAIQEGSSFAANGRKLALAIMALNRLEKIQAPA